MARRLIRQEGLLCGGSSGAAAWAAHEIARRSEPGTRIVTILPDSVRNYMTKFMDEGWMKDNGFTEHDWATQTVGDLLLRLPRRRVLCAKSTDTIADAVAQMKEHGVSQLPVVDNGSLTGIVTESDLLSRLVEGNASLAGAVAEVMFRKVSTLEASDDAGALLEFFARGEVGVVIDAERAVVGIITKMDLVENLTGSPSA